MATSSSVKRLAELSGSSHLKAEGVWAYRRPRARDGRARNLEVCRASDVFIVGEMNFWEREKIRGRHTDAHKGQYSEKVCFNANWDRRSPQSLPQTRGSIVPLRLRHFRIHREDSQLTGTMQYRRCLGNQTLTTLWTRVLSTETSCRMESVATVKSICSQGSLSL